MRWLICHIEPRATNTSIHNKQDNNNTPQAPPNTTYTVPDYLPDSDQEMKEPTDMSRGISANSVWDKNDSSIEEEVYLSMI